jgi:hypothetical protein
MRTDHKRSRPLVVRHPSASAIVTGVIAGLVLGFSGSDPTNGISIGLAGLMGGVWGIGWRWQASRMSRRSN